MQALAILVLSLLLIVAYPQTLISFITEIEEEPSQDYVEMKISTIANSNSLEKSINEARQKAERIIDLHEDICKKLMKNKADCKKSSELGGVQITPKY